MKSDNIERCCLEVFGTDSPAFWIDQTEGLLLKLPKLEYKLIWENYCLIYIEKGDGTITVDESVIRTDEPKVIFIKPGQFTIFDISRKTKGTILCFKEEFFSLRYNNNLLYSFSFVKNGVRPFQRLNDEYDRKLNSFLGFMKAEFNSERVHKNKVLRSYLNILLFELDEMYGKHTGNHTTKTMHDKIVAFEKLLEEKFSEVKSPGAYAEMMYISENYLNKLSKQYKGKTAGELIRERIIIEAQRLLYHTSDSVSQIADSLGFDNLSYFIIYFKRGAGYTPEEYRKKMKN